ncbi:MAG: ThiF family adenylyltransferase [Candidatus Rehaiarchaeum fermentans]|nr:ThiF family adenylyltransferase [Candidatus Rehaiarchaeum fermentans]
MSRLLLVGLGVMGNAILTSFRLYQFSEIYVMDGDFIDSKNLFSQPLYDKGDIGKLKAEVISSKLGKTGKKFIGIPSYLYNISQIEEISPDLIIDATDNISSKELINQYSLTKNVPAIITSVSESKGFAFKPTREYACFDCILSNSFVKQIECTKASLPIAIKLSILLNAFLTDKNNFLEISREGERRLLINKAKECKFGKIEMYQICGNSIKVLPRLPLDTGLIEKAGKKINDIIIVNEGKSRFVVTTKGEILAENASVNDINNFINKYKL